MPRSDHSLVSEDDEFPLRVTMTATVQGKPMHLRWDAPSQRFLSVPVEELDKLRKDASHMAVTRLCSGVFGVVNLGTCKVLLYVSARRAAATLPFGHKVYAIDALQLLLLPPSSDVTISPLAITKDLASGADKGRAAAGTAELKQRVRREYLAVVNNFIHPQPSQEGLHLFVSYTTDISVSSATQLRMAAAVDESRASNREPRKMNDWDLSTRDAQSQESSVTENAETLQSQSPFSWNATLTDVFPTPHFVAPVMRGYVAAHRISRSPQLEVALIGRVCARYAGTRYNRRGIDDNGYAANFVETEQIVWSDRALSTFLMIRGSVPFQWQQSSDFSPKPIPVILAPESATTQFERHVDRLLELYPWTRVIHCLDLLSGHRCEVPLTGQFSRCVSEYNVASTERKNQPEDNTNPSLPQVDIIYTHYNMGHAIRKARKFCEVTSSLLSLVCGSSCSPEATKNAALTHTLVKYNLLDSEGDGSRHPTVLNEQSGLLRINCLDCLDRSNVAQHAVAAHMAHSQLEDIATLTTPEMLDGIVELEGQVAAWLRTSWHQHGCVISMLYAGAEALFADIIREDRRSKRGWLKDGTIGLRRYIQQHFFDGAKQDAISLVTGAHDPRALQALKYSNPFARRLTSLNYYVFVGWLVGIVAWCTNLLLLVFSTNFCTPITIGIQVAWSIFNIGVIIAVRSDAASYADYPVLT